jgi:PKD repeat protein
MSIRSVPKILGGFLLLICIGCSGLLAQEPTFFIYGPGGSAEEGATSNEWTVFVEVPLNEERSILISVYDPDTGGMLDAKKVLSRWDTSTTFEVYGESLLERQVVGKADGRHDGSYLKFGPYRPSQGVRKKNSYCFKLVIEVTEGDDANIFRIKIEPNEAVFYADRMPLYLDQRKSEILMLHPLVPEGTSHLVVSQFHLKAKNVEAGLRDPLSGDSYALPFPGFERWGRKVVPLRLGPDRFLDYSLKKLKQKNVFGEIKLQDDRGMPLCVYSGSNPALEALLPAKAPDMGSSVSCDGVPSITGLSFVLPEKACVWDVLNLVADLERDVSKAIKFHWSFGDGTEAFTKSVKKIYTAGGTYTVMLTAHEPEKGPCGQATAQKTIHVNTPPEARAGEDVRREVLDPKKDFEVLFDASESRDPDGDGLHYDWDFGDDSRGKGVKVNHTYAALGAYKVTLTVSDSQKGMCSKGVDFLSVKLMSQHVEPMPELEQVVCEGDVLAVDASEMINAEDGNKTNYLWDFGDGNIGEGGLVSYRYPRGGNYQIQLTAGTGDQTKNYKIPVIVNAPPILIVKHEPDVCIDEEVNFDARESSDSNGDPLMFEWDFGEGSVMDKTGLVSRSYSIPGTYQVKLTADDGRALSCSRSAKMFSVRVHVPPLVQAGEDRMATVLENVLFSAKNGPVRDGRSLTYLWNFGDGHVEIGENVSHAFAREGQYRVVLTVNDGLKTSCSSQSDDFLITVVSPSKPEDRRRG